MMKRALLRLKGGKGSVLFFIIAIMSVMIVLASAVYYSTVSARKQVEIEYGDEQSYQSAIALNNIISDYITKKPNSDFVKTIAGMNPQIPLSLSLFRQRQIFHLPMVKLRHTHTQLRATLMRLRLMLHFQLMQQQLDQVGTITALQALLLRTPTVQLSTISGAVQA